MRIIFRAVDRSLDIYLKALDGDASAGLDDGSLLKIGTLSRRAGVANSTIRQWTKEDLLEVADVTESGYQLYAPEMLGA